MLDQKPSRACCRTKKHFKITALLNYQALEAHDFFFFTEQAKAFLLQGEISDQSKIIQRSRGALLLLAEITSELKGGGIKCNSLLVALLRHRQLSTGVLLVAIKVCPKRPFPPSSHMQLQQQSVKLLVNLDTILEDFAREDPEFHYF